MKESGVNTERVHASIGRKLLGWLIGGFVTFLAVAVLLAALSAVAFAGRLGLLFFVAFGTVAVLLAALSLYGIRRLAE